LHKEDLPCPTLADVVCPPGSKPADSNPLHRYSPHWAAILRRILLVSLFAAAQCALSQTGSTNSTLPDAPQAQSSSRLTIRAEPVNILRDQRMIWTSPLRIRAKDLKYLVPLGVAAGVAIATDKTTMRDVVTHDPAFNNDSTNASNVMIGGFIAAPVILYGVGHFRGNEHAREAGLVSAEALVDGVAVEEGLKLISWRERPYQDQQRGRFFQSSAGVDSSFPSSHAVLAWSTAAAIAGEYHNPWTEALVYSGAAGISMARLMGQQHFPGDLLVGSAAGWLVGHYVYKHRHRWAPVRHDTSR
jgi:hypothetical protein